MRLFLATVLAMTSCAVSAEAADSHRLPRLQLSYQSELVQHKTKTRQETLLASNSELSNRDSTAHGYFVGDLKRYDATFLYPVSQSERINVDLGLNLRYFDGTVSVESPHGRLLQNYRSAIPMFYASALFDLPFKGLSARVDGGSQLNVEWDKLFTSFDYKASLRYDWDNGIGLEGGWQQRQWQLDNLGSSDSRVESRGLFLDLNYQF